ncbi:hypothetical protein P3S67_008343 [Capsicum chacoense]
MLGVAEIYVARTLQKQAWCLSILQKLLCIFGGSDMGATTFLENPSKIDRNDSNN